MSIEAPEIKGAATAHWPEMSGNSIARKPILTHALLTAACATLGGTTSTLLSADSELYGAGIFSTGAWDYFTAWTPDQREVFFDRADDNFSAFEILETRLGPAGHWSKPAHPEFAQTWSNSDPHITPDGRRLFFMSNRPLSGDTAARQSYDIWYTDRPVNASWKAARLLDAPFNDPASNEWSPSITASGDIYFGSNKPVGGRGDFDLWVSRFVEGKYANSRLKSSRNVAHSRSPTLAAFHAAFSLRPARDSVRRPTDS